MLSKVSFNSTRKLLWLLVLATLLLMTWSLGQEQINQYNEAPLLAQRVAAGELPPVAERLPENPLVVPVVERIGDYGGSWRTALVGGADLA